MFFWLILSFDLLGADLSHMSFEMQPVHICQMTSACHSNEHFKNFSEMSLEKCSVVHTAAFIVWIKAHYILSYSKKLFFVNAHAAVYS